MSKALFDSTANTTERWQKSFINIVIVVVVISGILTSLYFSGMNDSNWVLLSFNEDLAENWQNIFTKYFFIIVALERAAAVWIGITRSQDKRAWEKRVIRLRQLFERESPDSTNRLTLAEVRVIFQRERKIIADIEANDKAKFLGNPDPTIDSSGKPIKFNSDIEEMSALTAYLNVCKQVYEFKLAKFEEQSARQTTKLVFFGGLVLAIIGISLVSDIVNVSQLMAAEALPFQKFLYRIVDVLITGGLIGGGSKGFSLFISTLNNVFERVKDPKSSI